MMNRLRLIVCSFYLSGCVAHHSVRPNMHMGEATSQKIPQKLTYSLSGGTFFGGADELRNIFREDSPFESVEYSQERPERGYHVDVRVEIIPPNMAAFVWGYIAVVGTLTILPAWTGRDGSRIFFDVHQDGKKLRTYEYEVKRKALVWIVALPFIWTNLLTRSEADAFKIVARQFMAEFSKVARST